MFLPRNRFRYSYFELSSALAEKPRTDNVHIYLTSSRFLIRYFQEPKEQTTFWTPSMGGGAFEIPRLASDAHREHEGKYHQTYAATRYFSSTCVMCMCICMVCLHVHARMCVFIYVRTQYIPSLESRKSLNCDNIGRNLRLCNFRLNFDNWLMRCASLRVVKSRKR